MNHSSSVGELCGIGEKILEKFSVLGIHTIADLALHLPRDYQDLTSLTPPRDIMAGRKVLVEGHVLSATHAGRSRKTSLVCVDIGHRTINLRFFHLSFWHKKYLEIGKKIRIFGKVSYAGHNLEITHPDISEATVARQKYLTPIYPLTYGMHQKMMGKTILQALAILKKDTLFCQPISYGKESKSFIKDLYAIHVAEPKNRDILLNHCHPSQKRLGLLEASVYHYLINASEQNNKDISFVIKSNLYKEFIEKLPFRLTSSQNVCVEEILHDMSKPEAMVRVLHGDVGSGKTVVAASCILDLAKQGLQAVVVAPTTILAQQHYKELQNFFHPYGIEIELYISSLKTKKKKDLQDRMAEGSIPIVVGTHALLQKDVSFKQLALVVFDEQHCFGVEQRAALRNKNSSGMSPHQLVMTATPIPRTLSIVLGGRVSLSSITELPKERKAIKTVIIKPALRDILKERLKAALLRGEQVYWVCPSIEENEDMPSTQAVYKELVQIVDKKDIVLLHGDMSEDDKEKSMQDFIQAKSKLMISTTVVAVGVNVAAATIMIIDSPEFFGLAQLHQLRGRVGRSDLASKCVVLPNQYISNIAKQRLEIFRSLSNGLELAKQDLRLRGAGEIAGIKQSGLVNFHFYDQNMQQDYFEDELQALISKIGQKDYMQAIAQILFPEAHKSMQTV